MQSEMAYVYKVFQEKSFTKAAEELFMTQPALSMAIRKVLWVCRFLIEA